MGRARRIEDARGRYIVFLKNTFSRELTMEGLKIVLDVSNGATYKAAPEAFTELGAQVEVIHDKPNGLNINENCGSQHTHQLQERVVESHAHVGLAFDGDGDRLIAVDEKGHALTGDQTLVICANVLKRENKLSNDLVVCTVMSNLGLRFAAKKHGFKLHTSKVGDRYVLEDMLRLGGVIGGEDSGHTIFLQHHKTGDGIISAMQLIAAMIKEARPMSELAAQMDVFPQELINVPVTHKPEIATRPKIVAAIKQAEAELGDTGRVLVRYSGTENKCRVMVEGPTHEVTKKYCAQIAAVVKAELG